MRTSSWLRGIGSLVVAVGFSTSALATEGQTGASESAATAPATQDTSSAPAAKRKPPLEFDKYSMVFLKRGDKWTPDVTPAIEELQRQHLAHLTRMAEEGKLVVAGPVADQPDPSLRGFALYVVPLEEARKLAEADPMVKAGRLEVEVLTWWVEKGALAFPLAKPAKSRAK